MVKSKKINTVEKKTVSTKEKPTNKPKETISTNNKKEKVISKPMERLVTKENPTTKPKRITTPPVVHNIQEFNIGDNIIFMCLGCETNGVVIKVDKGNKLLVVKAENNIIYHVHLSKTNSQFFYVI